MVNTVLYNSEEILLPTHTKLNAKKENSQNTITSKAHWLFVSLYSLRTSGPDCQGTGQGAA